MLPKPQTQLPSREGKIAFQEVVAQLLKVGGLRNHGDALALLRGSESPGGRGVPLDFTPYLGRTSLVLWSRPFRDEGQVLTGSMNSFLPPPTLSLKLLNMLR